MKAAARSDIGRVRENNEDTVFADTERGIFLLADGMGGHAGGEVASELAVRTAHDLIARRLGAVQRDDLPRLLAEALAAAHSAIFRRGAVEPGLTGMGTTLEMVVIKEGEAFICHLGDSRVYLFRGGALLRLTNDDNVAALLAAGDEDVPEETLRAARHILTQAVGVSDELVPEIRRVFPRAGDIFLICSDGLTEMLTDDDIEAMLRRQPADLDAVAEFLVGEANSRGGVDNVSVVLIAPEAAPVPQMPVPEQTARGER